MQMWVQFMVRDARICKFTNRLTNERVHTSLPFSGVSRGVGGGGMHPTGPTMHRNWPFWGPKWKTISGEGHTPSTHPTSLSAARLDHIPHHRNSEEVCNELQVTSTLWLPQCAARKAWLFIANCCLVPDNVWLLGMRTIPEFNVRNAFEHCALYNGSVLV